MRRRCFDLSFLVLPGLAWAVLLLLLLCLPFTLNFVVRGKERRGGGKGTGVGKAGLPHSLSLSPSCFLVGLGPSPPSGSGLGGLWSSWLLPLLPLGWPCSFEKARRRGRELRVLYCAPPLPLFLLPVEVERCSSPYCSVGVRLTGWAEGGREGGEDRSAGLCWRVHPRSAALQQTGLPGNKKWK